MKVAIMQPYFMPYIGYFQLIAAVDKFIIYDNIKFTKKGWINRNRILCGGKDEYISIPVRNDSDYLHIVDRKIAESFKTDREKMIRKISASYGKAPMYSAFFPVIDKIIRYDEENLFHFIYHSLKELCAYLKIETEFIVSSTININHELRAQEKVIALCLATGATHYINPIGGTELYSKSDFSKNNLELNFIQSETITYPQFNNEFVPWLSIIDVMMFNDVENVRKMLNEIKLI